MTKILQQILLIFLLYTISYQFTVLVWGDYGILVRRNLQRVEAQMAQHYAQLEKHQRNLLALSEQIRSAPSYITVEARSLGYYEKNDRLILINTWQQTQPAPSPGIQFNPEIDEEKSNTRALLLQALLLTGGLWLIVRLLHFGRADVLPKKLGRRKLFPHAPHSQEQHSKLLNSEPYIPKRPGHQDHFQTLL